MSHGITELLFDVGLVKVSVSRPFTYASGLQGPVYCDNRKIISHVDQRRQVIDAFVELTKEKGLEFDAVGGLATAGITHAAWMAEKLNLPMCYIRSTPKGHGQGKQVEGDLREGSHVLLIEDLINQASSLHQVVEGSRREGLKVTDCIAIVDYKTPRAKEVCDELGVNKHALVSFDDIVRVAVERSLVTESELDQLKRWHGDPKNWSVQ